jgi:hypothetical protein
MNPAHNSIETKAFLFNLIIADVQPASLSSPSTFIGDPDFQISKFGFPIRIASGMTVFLDLRKIDANRLRF